MDVIYFQTRAEPAQSHHAINTLIFRCEFYGAQKKKQENYHKYTKKKITRKRWNEIKQGLFYISINYRSIRRF